ncbi:hypothetical protein SAY86_019854 [Trapa natans]|uniref:Auxin response factor n=1 Tax=Trapa natans TaxID=22666 RepID=A0AAN7LMG7_TRANT|nr:hypothetical protein SAY86_019854 [Trapa natans]
MDETESGTLDPQLWHACAGSMIQMPLVNSTVFYFPQGHAEHSSSAVHFSNSPSIPASILCRVSSVKLLADHDTDEVYTKIMLVPQPSTYYLDSSNGSAGILANSGVKEKKVLSFAKALTQSDANNGGGFSVPRYCAETIFPLLDYSADPPVQMLIARDVHGKVWKFRHIYRGTPRRHLLTTGWSSFVSCKRLVAGDSIVFFRGESSELRVGIRRTKQGLWGYGSFLEGGESKLVRMNGFGRGKTSPGNVINAVALATRGQPFEVVFYPGAGMPEFCVKASSVRAAMRVQWSPGMRFKMAFETEDCSRISWYMGTVSSVHVSDPVRWPNSPWRLLQVDWDEPDLLQCVTRINPWLIELVSNTLPTVHHPLQFTGFPILEGKLLVPRFSSNLVPASTSGLIPNNFAPASIQGARHTHSPSIFSDLSLQAKIPHTPFRLFQPPLDPHFTEAISTVKSQDNEESLSSSLTIGYPSQNNNPASEKKRKFLLFGQIISPSSLSDTASESFPTSNLQDPSTLKVDTGHCKVFLESEDVGINLDLSVLGSYDELYDRLVTMFGMERSDLLINNVLYEDGFRVVRKAGSEPFSDFTRKAKRLTILMDSGCKSIRRSLLSPTKSSSHLSTYADCLIMAPPALQLLQ